MTGIYKITNPKNSVYIGSSKNIKVRHTSYKNLNCSGQFKLYNSIKKYSWEKHNVEILEECSEKDLSCRERFWQDKFDATNRKNLNLVLVECGQKRRVFSKEALRTIGDRQKGGSNPKAKKAINVQTGEEFECIRCLATSLGITISKLTPKLNSIVSNDTPYIYKENYEDFLKGLFTNVNIIKDRRLGWEVINIKTGEVFSNIKEASKTYKDFKYRTIVDWLRFPDKNKSPFIYLKDYNN